MTEYYEKAMAVAPENSEVLSSYAKTLTKYNKADDAKIVYEKAMSVETVSDDEKFENYVTLADSFYKKSDFASALLEYKKALEIRPSDEIINIKLGNTYKGLSQLKEAIEAYDMAIKIAPDNADSYFNKGLCQAELNDLSNAKINFEKVISLKPDYAYAYYALGLSYEKEKDLVNAIQNYEKFIEYSTDKNLKNNVQNKVNNLKKKLPIEEVTE
jgi:tetratricopeptide (TPR) repeat protein